MVARTPWKEGQVTKLFRGLPCWEGLRGAGDENNSRIGVSTCGGVKAARGWLGVQPGRPAAGAGKARLLPAPRGSPKCLWATLPHTTGSQRWEGASLTPAGRLGGEDGRARVCRENGQARPPQSDTVPFSGPPQRVLRFQALFPHLDSFENYLCGFIPPTAISNITYSSSNRYTSKWRILPSVSF